MSGSATSSSSTNSSATSGAAPSVAGSIAVAAGVMAFGWLIGIDLVRVGGFPVLAVAALVAVAINWVAFVPSWRFRTERFYDLTGSLTYIVVTTVAIIAAPQRTLLGWVVAVMVIAWAARLGSFLFRRVMAAGFDRRFESITASASALFLTWTMQALWVVLTAGCGLAIIVSPVGSALGGVELNGWRSAVAVCGCVVWLIGFTIEVVSDRQKRQFRANPDNADSFISSGLWALSRHPNYFGEIVLWCGIACIGMAVLSGWALVSLVSPLFVYLLITRVSGVPMLERSAAKRWGATPEYQEYVSNTPELVPGRPRRG